MPQLNNEFMINNATLYPLSSIVDIKIYYSQIEYLNENFFLFKILTYISHLELIDCSISNIKDNLFKNWNLFQSLEILTLTNNKITRI